MLKAFNSIFYGAIFMGAIWSSDALGQAAPASLSVPDWVNMMDDPNVNYFDAVASYKSYWMTHDRPPGEEEEMEQTTKSAKGQETESEKERERESRKKKLKGAKLEQVEYLKYESKRFENWAREVKPWVQENGHVLNEEERAEIARKQQEELQQQNKK